MGKMGRMGERRNSKIKSRRKRKNEIRKSWSYLEEAVEGEMILRVMGAE